MCKYNTLLSTNINFLALVYFFNHIIVFLTTEHISEVICQSIPRLFVQDKALAEFQAGGLKEASKEGLREKTKS